MRHNLLNLVFLNTHVVKSCQHGSDKASFLSVFIRDSSDVKLAVSCQQFRFVKEGHDQFHYQRAIISELGQIIANIGILRLAR